MARREELRLTQSQLADRIGYKSKTSINKIELGLQGIPQAKMRDFASALQTDIPYLMGEYEEYKDKEDLLLLRKQVIRLVEIETDMEVLRSVIITLTERRQP